MRRALLITLAAIAAIALAGIYYVYDPAGGLFPRCVFNATTGLRCPGCGSQRAIHALLHGDIATAFRYNALLIISLPLIAALLLAEWHHALHPRRNANPGQAADPIQDANPGGNSNPGQDASTHWITLNAPWIAIAYLILTIAWTITRNIFGW